METDVREALPEQERKQIRFRLKLLFVGIFLAIVLVLLGKLGLHHFGEPHQRFYYGSKPYYRAFAAACDTLLAVYGTNVQTSLFNERLSLVRHGAGTNFVTKNGRYLFIPIENAEVPHIIRELNPLEITVLGDELVGISLYHLARGGFQITWSRRQWSEDANSLYCYWRDENPIETVVYRDQSNQRIRTQTGMTMGSPSR